MAERRRVITRKETKVTKHSAHFRRPPLAAIRRVSLSLSALSFFTQNLIIINCEATRKRKSMKEEKMKTVVVIV
jgi:hypothetical protein